MRPAVILPRAAGRPIGKGSTPPPVLTHGYPVCHGPDAKAERRRHRTTAFGGGARYVEDFQPRRRGRAAPSRRHVRSCQPWRWAHGGFAGDTSSLLLAMSAATTRRLVLTQRTLRGDPVRSCADQRKRGTRAEGVGRVRGTPLSDHPSRERTSGGRRRPREVSRLPKRGVGRARPPIACGRRARGSPSQSGRWPETLISLCLRRMRNTMVSSSP